MSRAIREWALIMVGMFSPVILAIACYAFYAYLENKHYEAQPLHEVELDIRPKGLTENWFLCGHHGINETGQYLDCMNGLQARIDF